MPRMKQRILLAAALLVLSRATQTHAGSSIGACGKVITASGSYVLKNNLAVKPKAGDCITVNASNVTIDLGGYNINCGSTTAVGIITGANTAGITIRNGIIANCNDGIRAAASTGVVIDEIVALSNVGAGIYVGGDSSVMHSIANSNGFAGILVQCPSNISYNTAVNNNPTSGHSHLYDIGAIGVTCSIFTNAVDP
jgi:hypothetical protein